MQRIYAIMGKILISAVLEISKFHSIFFSFRCNLCRSINEGWEFDLQRQQLVRNWDDKGLFFVSQYAIRWWNEVERQNSSEAIQLSAFYKEWRIWRNIIAFTEAKEKTWKTSRLAMTANTESCRTHSTGSNYCLCRAAKYFNLNLLNCSWNFERR